MGELIKATADACLRAQLTVADELHTIYGANEDPDSCEVLDLLCARLIEGITDFSFTSIEPSAANVHSAETETAIEASLPPHLQLLAAHTVASLVRRGEIAEQAVAHCLRLVGIESYAAVDFVPTEATPHLELPGQLALFAA